MSEAELIVRVARLGWYLTVAEARLILKAMGEGAK